MSVSIEDRAMLELLAKVTPHTDLGASVPMERAFNTVARVLLDLLPSVQEEAQRRELDDALARLFSAGRPS